nr:hypothetical protein [Tanacetum cinerariifolium]
MVELSSLSRITIVPKEWLDHIYDPNYIAIIRHESTSIKFLQTPRYPKPQRVASFNMLEPKLGTTNVLEVNKDPLLELTCMESSEKSLGAIVRGFSPRVESLGLGFDASTNTFKMVCVLRKDDKNPCTMVHVLGTNTWREIPQVVPSCPIADKCVYANGCLYWFAKSKATNELRFMTSWDATTTRIHRRTVEIQNLSYVQDVHNLAAVNLKEGAQSISIDGHEAVPVNDEDALIKVDAN